MSNIYLTKFTIYDIIRIMNEPEIQDTTYWLMGAILSTVRERVAHVANAHGLTIKQAEALCTLVPGQPQPIRVLRERISCDASSATGILDRLERRGFIERLPDLQDRRIRAVAITPTGRNVRSLLIDEILQAQNDQLSILSKSEAKALTKLLKKL